MPEPPATAIGLVELNDLDQLDVAHRPDDHLRDPIAGAHRHRVGTVVHEDYADLAPIIRVDRAGRVEQRDPLTVRQAAARPNLRLVARG